MSGTDWQLGLTERCAQVVTAYTELYAHLDSLANRPDRVSLMQYATDKIDDMVGTLATLE